MANILYGFVKKYGIHNIRFHEKLVQFSAIKNEMSVKKLLSRKIAELILQIEVIGAL